MKKRGIFSKIFGINIVSMLICIIVLGSTQTIMLTNYISRYSENYLSKNAETVVNMINGNIPLESLKSVLNGFARASGSYIIVFDKKGAVLSYSDESKLVTKPPAFLEDDYTKSVLSGQKHSVIGTMGGLFSDTMFTLQLPIYGYNGEVLGAVSMSRPIPEQQKMKYDLFKMLLISMGVIAVTSFALSYLLAKSISMPMKKISETTKEFAKGNFSVRVDSVVEGSGVSEISELAEAFNNMATELEKSEEIKNAFISDVSHELRTPMTTIGGFVSGMLDDTIPEEKHKEYLKIVYSEINRLSRLVNTFLDITRLQSDKMVLKKVDFDINEVIRVAVIGFENKIETRRINVELNFENEKCFVFADRDSIIRVVTNLLDNAVKFTNDDGSIIVDVRERQHEIIISVKNTGRGISKEQIPMIFQRFYKADKSRSSNKEGTGIGLYLVKNILVAHGKDVDVNGIEGEYAEFVFKLDKGKSPQPRKIY